MNNKKNIVHIIRRDKFTLGYINFMNLYMTEYDHIFLVVDKNDSLSDAFAKIDNVKYYNKYIGLHPIGKYKDDFKEADKIIVSGVFGQQYQLAFWPKRLLKKTFVQFWGGDFYYLRKLELNEGLIHALGQLCSLNLFKRIKGGIFLLEEEEEEFKKITHINIPKTYTAQMMDDPLDLIDYSEYEDKDSNANDNGTLKVMVGNSATECNCHLEAFEKLSKVQSVPFKVICPLSYGDEEYKKLVIEKGYELFQDRFVPLQDWMNKQEYFKYLSEIDVGIFANDRQQGLGNIYFLLRCGKMVYLKSDTSSFKNIKNQGIKIFDFYTLNDEDFINRLSANEKKNNMEKIEYNRSMENARKQWNTVFLDN